MHHYFYLFGLDGVKLYEEDIHELIKKIKEDPTFCELMEYNESKESPDDLLNSFNGWNDYIRISETEYRYIMDEVHGYADLANLGEFIRDYTTTVKEDEDTTYVELMMNNHICIEFKGNQYYVPEENSSWVDDDREIFEFFKDHFLIN